MNADYSDDTVTESQDEPKPANVELKIQKWLQDIASARKREKTFRKDGHEIVKLYEAVKCKAHQFNILFSNTETLAPALYNATPRPLVQRRFKDEDPIGKHVSKVLQRTLEFLIDPGEGKHIPFDDLMSSAVLEALLPGRGFTRFKYDAEVQDEQVIDETIFGEEVPWDRFTHGYAKKWDQVPWIAFDHFFTRAELKQHFPDMADKIPAGEDDVSEDEDNADGDMNDRKDVKLAHVIEIWDKTTRKVCFIAPSYPSEYIKETDDPLGLTGFFPGPRPLMFTKKISTLTPVALYQFYKAQAEELNTVTYRINKLVAALKARGAYDAGLEGLEKILKADDNEMVPLENIEKLDGKPLESALWMVPIDKLIVVLQQLYLFRNQVKQVIYEITGIADIMRGSSQASETLGAQEIKNQWGTLRLKRSQKSVMMYVRESLRVMAQIAAKQFDKKTFAGMTGLQYPTAEEKAQAQAQIQQIQMMAQQQAAMQPPPQPGQPPAQPPQPQIPPELQVVMSLPSWEELIEVMQNDLLRSYKIDIETNSTVDAEATEDKQNIGELLNAIAQFLNGVTPLVEKGLMPFDAAKSMLMMISRRFRFGVDVEDELAKMQQPKPQEDPKAAADKAKADMDMEALKARMQADQAKNAMELQRMQAELQNMRERMALEMQALREKLGLERERMNMEREQMAFDMQAKRQQTALAMQAGVGKHALAEEGLALKSKQQQQQARQASRQPAKA